MRRLKRVLKKCAEHILTTIVKQSVVSGNPWVIPLIEGRTSASEVAREIERSPRERKEVKRKLISLTHSAFRCCPSYSVGRSLASIIASNLVEKLRELEDGEVIDEEKLIKQILAELFGE